MVFLVSVISAISISESSPSASLSSSNRRQTSAAVNLRDRDAAIFKYNQNKTELLINYELYQIL